MRSTKIVGTIGPASRDPEVLARMIDAGLDVARLNFAHGDPEHHAEIVGLVRAAADRACRQVAVLQDVPGPKLRIGPVAGDVAHLETGSRVVLTSERVEGDAHRLPVAWPGFAELLGKDDVVYLADGAIRLRVREARSDDVELEVEVGGTVASRQGMNLPNVTMSLPAVSEDDLRLVDAGIEMGVDLMALSFIKTADDLRPVREHLAAHGSDVPVLAKIEKPQAAQNIEEIVEVADGVMVARGDLGIELPIEEVPLVQKRLLYVAGQRSTPTITATQMLESMVHSTRPTRDEVTDVANAIFDGTDAVMLSEETAVGRHPVEAVRMMAAIAEATERELPYWRMLTERGLRGGDVDASVVFGVVGAVYQLGLKALVCPTMTGRTARLLSAHRPQVPTLALSPRPEVVRRCCLYWGVRAQLNEEPRDTMGLLETCAEAVRRAGLAGSGDRIGITAGVPMGLERGTNLFNVHTLA